MSGITFYLAVAAGLCLTFGVPLSVRSDAEGESAAGVMEHLYRWLKSPITHGATGHPRGQGAVERYVDGQDSHWMSEKEALDSFIALQLDVFHALWELYQPEKRPRPEEGPSKDQPDEEAREKALQLLPFNTEVQKPFVDGTGKGRVFQGRVYDFQDGYWRVEYTKMETART